MIGKPIQMLLPDRFRSHHRGHVQGFLEGNEARRMMSGRPELLGLRKGGEEFPVEITIAKITSSPLGSVLAAAIIRDVTEQHRMQEKIRERQAELEDLVESKDRLIAAVSHEIRTPLTSIVGFARLLHDNAASLSESERREMAETLVQQSGDLTNITEDLVVASKADIGKLTVARVSVDLRAQTAQVVEMWEPRADQQVRQHGETVRCVGDPARVRQIIRNLVANASRYGGPKIRIEVGTKPEGGFVLVADNGTEIEEHNQETIFEAYGFGRDQPGLAPSLGLGLYLSRSLARLMQGELNYRYQDRENIFELTLPLDKPGSTRDNRYAPIDSTEEKLTDSES